MLVVSLLECLWRFGFLRLGQRDLNARERAAWLHRCCLRITRRLGIVLTTHGSMLERGLVVSNHLSHLDILLYGSLGPVVFVSKRDVRSWPFMGLLAACGGTVFVDRERSVQAADAAREIETLLRGDVPVVLFPEGTSSDGTTVLPFRSPLFEPAIRQRCPVQAAAIHYAAEGATESMLAYYGDKVFFPHLCETLGHRRLAVTISFAESESGFSDRKQAARATHEAVTNLRRTLDNELSIPT
jgi:1-acyl-sn-glycerol-3-phosphate acyltransferase